MQNPALVSVLGDIAVIVFDLLLFTRLFQLRKNDAWHRAAMGLGCAAIVTAYFLAVYVFGQPASIASALCMSIPSFLLFLWLSRYRDARFVLTFCFADTITLVVGLLGRWMNLRLPYGGWLSLGLLLLLSAVILKSGWKIFHRYRELLEVEKAGWTAMAAAGVVIYFAFVFLLGYPEPLIQRQEYIPVALVFCGVVVACYVVLILSVSKTRQIHLQNQQLQEEKRYFQMAFTDALTGLNNRAAYMERLNTCERARPAGRYCCAMLDANQFKAINDTYGHAMGDQALKIIGICLAEVFGAANVFRMGGDEFSLLLAEETQAGMAGKLASLEAALREEGKALGLPLSMAVGWSIAESGGLEKAFAEADRRMYAQKLKS